MLMLMMGEDCAAAPLLLNDHIDGLWKMDHIHLNAVFPLCCPCLHHQALFVGHATTVRRCPDGRHHRREERWRGDAALLDHRSLGAGGERWGEGGVAVAPP